MHNERISSNMDLLGNKRFLPLFICQFLSAFGDNLIRTAMVTLVTYYSFGLTDLSKSLIVTLALCLFMLPFAMFSATAGQIADKYNKATLIKLIRFSSVFITMIAAAGFYYHNYSILLLAIFLTGVEATLFGPIKYSILPDHLERRQLIVANGLIEAGTFMAILLGMILGGLLISKMKGEVGIAIASLSIVNLGSFVASLFVPSAESTSKDLKISFNFWTETKNYIYKARQDKDVFLSMLGISWFWLVSGIMMSQLPTFTKDTLFSDNSVYTFLLSVLLIGTGLGSILCNKILKDQIDVQYVPISMLIITFFMFLFWYSSTFFIAKVGLFGIHYFLSTLYGLIITISVFMIAIFSGIYIVPLYALLQVSSSANYRSRVIATNNVVNAIFMVIASIVSIVILAIGISVSKLLLVLAIANLFTTVYIARILPDRIMKSILQTILKLVYRVEVIGIENFFKAGDRALVIANHASFLDPPLLWAFLPKTLAFAIDTFQAKSWWIRPFLAYVKAYPVDPANPMATKMLIEKLKSDIPVVIFPEGRLTATGSLMKIYEGPGLIADKANAYLLPIRIDGPQYTPFARLHKKLPSKLWPKIKITILEPTKINVPQEILGRRRRQVISKHLYDIMSNMMFEGSEHNLTLFESLLNARKRYGNNYEILDDAERKKLTYNKLIMGSFVLGKKFLQFTANKEYIGIFLPNVSATVVTFFAVQVFGRIPAMLNYSVGVKNVISSCKAAKIQTIITSRTFIKRASLQMVIKEIKKEKIKVHYLEDIRNNINIIDKILGIIYGYLGAYFYKKFNLGQDINSHTPAVILFTSGSEGSPKGVLLSHSNLQANIKQAASRVDFSSYDKVFNALPIFHSFGLLGGCLLPILSGVKTYFYPSPLHYRIIPEMVYGTNSTIIFGTDTFLKGYAIYAHPYDFFSIRYIFAGAEKLKEDTKLLYMEKFGIRILEGYGVTEASPIISLNTPMHYKAGTVGRIVPNITYHLEKIEGIEEGFKLIISGPNVMLGYLSADKPGRVIKPKFNIEGKLRKGWHDTGDIVTIDDDGYVTIIGRAKRFAKIAGEMVSLAIIEDLINKVYSNAESAVIVISDDKKGEMIVLFSTYEKCNKEEIHKYFKEQGFSELFVPRVIRSIEILPRLPTGKVDYVTLSEQFKSKEND